MGMLWLVRPAGRGVQAKITPFCVQAPKRPCSKGPVRQSLTGSSSRPSRLVSLPLAHAPCCGPAGTASDGWLRSRRPMRTGGVSWMWFSTLRGGERKFRRHGKCDDDGSRMVMEQLGSKSREDVWLAVSIHLMGSGSGRRWDFVLLIEGQGG